MSESGELDRSGYADKEWIDKSFNCLDGNIRTYLEGVEENIMDEIEKSWQRGHNFLIANIELMNQDLANMIIAELSKHIPDRKTSSQ